MSNPIHALSQAVVGWTSIELPQTPKSTFTVARTGGGKSINAIPATAWAEVDIRGSDPAVMADLALKSRRILEATVTAEAERSGNDRALHFDIEVLGERPPGASDPNTPLLHVARAATEAVGDTPLDLSASTDANVAMSLGIPAITLGAGGNAGLAHTEDEWFRNVRGVEGIIRGLLTIVGFAPILTSQTRVDLRANQTPLRDQGNRGTCTSFGAIAALEAAYKKAGYGNLDFSGRFGDGLRLAQVGDTARSRERQQQPAGQKREMSRNQTRPACRPVLFCVYCNHRSNIQSETPRRPWRRVVRI